MRLTDFLQLYIGVDTVTIAGKEYSTPTKDNNNNYIIPVLNSDDVVITPTLNVQTSMYHQESITDHVAYVVAKMSEYFPDDDTAIAIGLLHDIAKKYTVAINAKGGYCFYNHESLSAILAKDMVNDEIQNIVFSVISQHLQLKLLNDLTKLCFIRGFEDLCGKKALDYLTALNNADRGLTEEELNDPDIKATIAKGYDIIEKFEF